MEIRDLLHEVISGTPVKRKKWGGYWKYNSRIRNIEMYNADQTVMLLTNTEDVLFTLTNIAADDWEIATNSNCTIEVK